MMSSVFPLLASGLTRPISTRKRGLALQTQKQIHTYTRHAKHLQSANYTTNALPPFCTFLILLNGREILLSPLEPEFEVNANLRLHGTRDRVLCCSTLPPTSHTGLTPMPNPKASSCPLTQTLNLPYFLKVSQLPTIDKGTTGRAHATGRVHGSSLASLFLKMSQQPVHQRSLHGRWPALTYGLTSSS